MKYKKKFPYEFLKSLWIRPEDLEIYEEIGISIFKITGREVADTIDFKKLLNAYLGRSHDGNIVDLVNGFSVKSNLYIDNRDLDGFLNFFLEKPFSCFENCNTSECNYCEKFFKKIEGKYK